MKTRLLRKRHLEHQPTRVDIPAVIVASLGWLLTLIFILFIDPQVFGVVPVFFIIVFISMFTSFMVLLKNKKRSFIYSLGLVIFLFLRYFGMGNLLNFILIIGIVISIEIFNSPKQK